MAMPVPYEAEGRTRQKSRTRRALVAATRELLAQGITPQVEDAAEAAGISRTTAYRYFPNQRALLLAAHPEIQQQTLLPADAPDDVWQRLDLVMDGCLRIVVDWEQQLRAALRLSLETPSETPVLRQGRVIGWLKEALAPLDDQGIDTHSLSVAIRSATGIESFIWLTDVAGYSKAQAIETMRWSARVLLKAALDGDPPPVLPGN